MVDDIVHDILELIELLAKRQDTLEKAQALLADKVFPKHEEKPIPEEEIVWQ